MKKILYAPILLLFIFTGCVDDFDPRTREEATNPFHVIRLKAVANVILKNGTEYAVKVVADNDIIDQIKTVSESDTLLISNSAKGKWLNPERNYIVIEITSPEFRTFISDVSYSLRSDGTLSFNEFFVWNFYDVKISDIQLEMDGNYFFYWNNWLAGGKLETSGKLQTAYFNNYALHVIDASKLKAENVTMIQYGREDCSVRATAHLDYALNGPGNIILYGDPTTVLLEKTSTGSLIHGD